MARGEALSVYRTAIRATRKTFAGNKYMLDVSAAEFRKKFLENRHLTSEADIQKMLQIGRKAAEYVATMIIQSKVGDHFDYDVRGSEQPIEIPNAEGFCAGDKRLGSNMSQVHMAKEIKTCEIAAMGNMLMDNEREGLLGEGRKLLGEGRETASYVVQSKVDDRFHNDLKGAQQPNEIPSVERHCMSEAYKAKEIKTGEIAALEKIQSDNEREDGRNTTHYAINFKVDDGLYYDMKGTEQSTEIPFAGSHHFMRVESPGFGMSHVYMVRGIKTGEIFSLEKIRSENEREGLAEHGRKAANYVIQPLIEEGFNYDNGAGWQNEIPPVESHFRRTGHLGLGISQACMAKQIKTGEIIVSMEIRMGNVCSQAYMAKEIKRGEIAPLKKILMDCGREGRDRLNWQEAKQ